jgi:phosphoribosylamine---glycine ligase
LLEEKSRKPFVLEYNVRMGDPECQPLMMRMESDLLEYIISVENQSIDSIKPIKWKDKYSVCVVMASKGYPGKFKIGYNIRGFENTDKEDLTIFHAGTKLNNSNKLVTNGGRVIGVTSLGNTIEEATIKSYKNVEKISWGNNQQHYRKDIAKLT